MPPLIDDANEFLDTALNGFKKVLEVRNAGALTLYQADANAASLASDRARLDATTAIAQIEAKADVDRAKIAAANSVFSFDGARTALASGFGSLSSSPYTVPAAIAVAAFAGLYLARR
jgi:hypothetical protein